MFALRALHLGACIVLPALLAFAPLLSAHRSRYRRLVQSCLLIILTSGGLWFLAVLAEMSDLSVWQCLQPALLVQGWQTHFGQLSAARMALAAVLLAGLWRSRWPGLACALALLGSLAWAGHAGAAGDTLHLAIDLAHLLLAALWPGGLVPLHAWLRGLREDEKHARRAAAVAARFSRMSLLVVGSLAATGLANTWLMLSEPSDLYTTDYGRLLLLKLAFLTAMLALGAQNLRRWIPALASENASTALSKLRRNIALELWLALGLLLAVGAMGLTAPPIAHLHPS